MSLELAQKYVERLLGQSAGSRAQYRVLKRSSDRVEIVPDRFYRFTLLGGANNDQVTLSIFLGVGDLVSTLWEQEMRTLERLAGFSHPALPALVDGGHLEGIEEHVGAAFVRSIRRGQPATQEWFGRLVEAEPERVLPHLWLLADALQILHGARISHRALWPGALLVREAGHEPEGTASIESVEIARFEMSALMANLFNNRNGGATLQQIRETYLAEGPESQVYSPPERLRFLFDRPGGELGGPAGDIFSLGMIAADWLFTGSDRRPVTSYDDALQLQDETRKVVRDGARRRLPGQIAEMIKDMLDPTPTSRPTAYDVTHAFSAGYADTRMLLEENAPELPYLVSYMPAEIDVNLLPWGLIQDSATTPEGRDEVSALIETDMRGADVLHLSSGAEGFAPGDPQKLRRAQTVIIGRELTWFAEPFWVHKPGGGTQVFDSMMTVKYLRRTPEIEHRLGGLRVDALTRRVPMVEAEPAPIGDFEVACVLTEDRPSWAELVDRAETARTLSAPERDYLASLEWYLKYQQAMLDARTYAYDLDQSRDLGSDRVAVRWNPETDRSRNFGDGQALSRIAVLDNRRPDMATLVDVADGDSDRGRVHLAGPAPAFGQSSEAYDIVEVFEPDTIVVSTRGRRIPPATGWLRVSHDAGTPPQISRQTEALNELRDNRVLLNQLIRPRAQSKPNQLWTDAGGVLQGEGRAAVRAMLEHDGIFALQGPPGTGKTEVTAQAVADYLRKMPGARVLVTAQSHDALENLAVRITRKLGITTPPGSQQPRTLDRLALRVRSRATSDTNQELRGLQPAHLAEQAAAYSADRANQWLASRSSEMPALVPVLRSWLARAPEAHLELTRRIRTAANVVFATTGASTPRNLLVGATQEPFNWVVVEEAGRAWPTELALPLVRGVRWTLVGDHAQIGAYSRADVERFLEDLGGYEDDEIRAMYSERHRLSRHFGTFARFFEGPDVATAPTLTLSEQYRMDGDISSLIGDVFYKNSGGLKAMRERAEHPLEQPGYLAQARLIWLDTGLASRSVPFWANEYEAMLCAQVVREMRPEPGRRSGPSLAVLTPYRDQVRVLQERLTEYHQQIHTVDGFQGREADIVVASLVRDRIKPGGTAISTVGHLASPNRINVLLSRAREVLVIVGRLDVYAHHAGREWRAVVDRFYSDGLVIKVKDGQVS